MLSTKDGSWRQVTDFGVQATVIVRQVSWSPDGQHPVRCNLLEQRRHRHAGRAGLICRGKGLGGRKSLRPSLASPAPNMCRRAWATMSAKADPRGIESSRSTACSRARGEVDAVGLPQTIDALHLIGVKRGDDLTSRRPSLGCTLAGAFRRSRVSLN